MSEVQKISWENYMAEIELMCIKTRTMKNDLLKSAKQASWWSTAIGYPSKILLTITAAGGGIQIFGQDTHDAWITIVRTVLEILVLILVSAKDSFNFAKKAEKYYTAARAVGAFYDMIKFQSYQIKGTEGDRLSVLKNYKDLYSEIVSNNQIIQTVEIASTTPTPIEIESPEDDDQQIMQTANNSPRHSQVPENLQFSERHRMSYLHKMIEGL